MTCTPHYKQDADRPWVTQEGVGIISLWMNPNTRMTIEDVANLIEGFASNQVAEQLAAQPGAQIANVKFENTIHNMTFRGQTIRRELFASYLATDYMHDGEAFNLLYAYTTRAGFPLWVVLCPCCIFCYLITKACQPASPRRKGVSPGQE